MNIYVGNLPYQTSEDDLKQQFGAFGQVSTATIIKDRETGRSKGFGFVEMPAEAEAKAAIDALNGKEFQGRKLNVNEARPRPEGGPRGGGNGRPNGFRRNNEKRF